MKKKTGDFLTAYSKKNIDLQSHPFFSAVNFNNLFFFFSIFSVHCRVWICAGHGFFRNNQAASLGCVHRLCRCWSPDSNFNVVSMNI